MRLRAWESAAAVLGGLLSFLYLAVGQFFVAATILGFTVFLLALRIRFDANPDERAGTHALRHFRVETAEVLGLLIALVATLATTLVGALHHWQRERLGSVALFALYGMEILLMMEIQRRGDSALNWLIGSRAEQQVGAELESLRDKGWLVIHRLVKDFGGDVDHLVCGPHGAYAIETKSGDLLGDKWAKHKPARDSLSPSSGSAGWFRLCASATSFDQHSRVWPG